MPLNRVFCPLRPRDTTRTIRHAQRAQQLTLCTGEPVCGPAACLPLRQTHLHTLTARLLRGGGHRSPVTPSTHRHKHHRATANTQTRTHTVRTHTHKHRRATPKTHTHTLYTVYTHTLHTGMEEAEKHHRATPQTHTSLSHTPHAHGRGKGGQCLEARPRAPDPGLEGKSMKQVSQCQARSGESRGACVSLSFPRRTQEAPGGREG